MDNLTHEFSMPIGDWSDDGHGQCEYYIFKSNKPIEAVREAHFKIKEATGIDIEKICDRYQESTIKPDVMEQLKSLHFDFENKEGDEDFSDNHPYPQGMARLWAFLLQKADLELILEQVEDNRPMLVFYGFDEKKRHISGPGYGLFD